MTSPDDAMRLATDALLEARERRRRARAEYEAAEDAHTRALEAFDAAGARRADMEVGKFVIDRIRKLMPLDPGHPWP